MYMAVPILKLKIIIQTQILMTAPANTPVLMMMRQFLLLLVLLLWQTGAVTSYGEEPPSVTSVLNPAETVVERKLKAVWTPLLVIMTLMLLLT